MTEKTIDPKFVECTLCGVPGLLHGTCCGWANAVHIIAPGVHNIHSAITPDEIKKAAWETFKPAYMAVDENQKMKKTMHQVKVRLLDEYGIFGGGPAIFDVFKLLNQHFDDN